jgi:predicted transcriptional regulator
MTTFTLTLPDDLAERLAVLPKDQVNAFAVSALSQLVGNVEDDALFLNEEDLDAEIIAAIEEGLDDIKAGNLRTLEQVDAAVEAALTARFGPAGLVGKTP